MKSPPFLSLFLFNLSVAILFRMAMLQMSSHPPNPTTLPSLAGFYFVFELFLLYGGHVLFGMAVAYRYTKIVHPPGQKILQLIIFAFVNAFMIYLFRDFRYSSVNIVVPFLPAIMQATGVAFGHGLRETIESCHSNYGNRA